MVVKQKIRCPNCGSHGERSFLTKNDNQITQTSCPVCDYLMINCTVTGRVFEAYAPGLASSHSFAKN